MQIVGFNWFQVLGQIGSFFSENLEGDTQIQLLTALLEFTRFCVMAAFDGRSLIGQ